jgi:hypothetical protein
MVATAARHPTALPAGLTDRGDRSVWQNMPFLDPTRFHLFFNDFDQYAAGDWVVTETQAGATQATVSGDGGILALVNSAADNDVNSIQQAFPSFTFADGKMFCVKTRFKLSDATQTDALIGAYVTDTSPIASVPTDGIGFLKDDDAATIKFQVGTGSAYTNTAALLTMADDTYYTLGAFCNGKAFVKNSDNLTYYSFLVYGGTDNDPAFITRLDVLNTAVPSANVLAPTICLQNGEAVAKTLSIDYLLVAKER